MTDSEFLLEIDNMTDAERKRIEYIAEKTGSRKPKHAFVMNEEGMKMVVNKIPYERIRVRVLGAERHIEEMTSYTTEMLEVPSGMDERTLNYLMKSQKLTREGAYLRGKRGTVEVTELDLSDKPHMKVRYNTSGGARITEKLRGAIELYANTV
ncbi:MAG: hypothetical protein V1836_02495 [Candidatus Aenigmatarchaeota archaeon]